MSLVTNDIIRIFTEMGFEVATGPEMEEEWYNFDALNVPKDHPARDMQDTFWIKNQPNKVLRTHTTGVTARYLEQAAKEGTFPCAYVSIGKVFRNEATDATHEMQFFQVDGCAVTVSSAATMVSSAALADSMATTAIVRLTARSRSASSLAAATGADS
jgi:phenylalanyl-tRNA synthetase alpha chain